jgi:hypothetical protein
MALLSNVLPIAGTVFSYDIRPDKTEALTARGPLTEQLEIAVIHQQSSKDVAIKFEFSIALQTDIKFIYRPGEWSTCSVTCGLGMCWLKRHLFHPSTCAQAFTNVAPTATTHSRRCTRTRTTVKSTTRRCLC